MISKIFSIRNYIMKQLLKTDKSGIMKLPDKGNVDFGEMIIKEDLFKKGIDPKAITSETQLDSILNAPHVPTKPKKTGEVIDVDFDKGRWKDIDPEDLAYGGVAGMLGERDGYYKGSMAKSRPKKKFRFSPPWMGPSIHQREESHQVPDRVNAQGHGVNFPYKSLEDIPPDVLAMLMKDPVFDLETFLKKVAWSDPDKTRIQKKKKGEKEPPWGAADHYGNMLLYKQKFGKGEPIAGGALTLKSPSDADKVQTILHEMRHSKMREPWFMKSSAIPKYVRETEDPHYSFQKYGDRDDDPNKFVGGEELYIRYLDQLYGDVSEKGDIAGSDYKPYFDKILREEWAPHAKAYKEILEEEKRVKSKPYGLAGGGRTGSGLNYLLGEDDQNMRVPYGEGSSWEQFQKEKLMQKWQEYQQYLKNREKEERQKPYLEERLGVGPGPVLEAAEGGRARFAGGGMGRRAFLKLMAALGATGVAAKSGLATLLKGGAKTKALTSVPIKDISGMPAWFKPLVNKVIKDGDDVTKKFATQERQIVHKTELPDSKTDVIVTQDLNTGNVSVELGMTKHGFADGKFGQPVRLEYKASEVIEPTVIMKGKKGKVISSGKKKPEEFWVEEAEFTGGHPENVKFEESSFNKFGKHESNFDEVEAFAKGKTKKTRKISPLQKQSEDLADHFSNYPEPDDFASGGRVPFIFGGGAIKNAFKRLKDVKKLKGTEKMLKKNPNIQHLLSTGDKQTLKELETQFSEQLLRMLKKDRELMLQIQSNKAMQDEGLDFLMKQMQESMAPHIKKYKSIEEIDEAILNMENIIKNKAVKEGRHLNASGGLAGMLGE